MTKRIIKTEKSGTLRFGFRADIVSGRVSSRKNDRDQRRAICGCRYCDESKTFEPVINSVEDYYTLYAGVAGCSLCAKVTWPIIYQYDEPENVILRVKSTDDMTRVGKRPQIY